MKQTLKAIYKNEVFRPLEHLAIPEGQEVQLVVETASKEPPEYLLKLAAQVYQGLSDKQIAEVEQIALNRRDFFGTDKF